jgi:hypothetical protein
MPDRPRRRAAVASLALAAALSSPVPGAAQPAPTPPPSASPPPSPAMLEIGARIGGVGRLGGSPAYPISSRGSVVGGASVMLEPSPRWGVGLIYERVGLGAERTSGELGTVELSRAADVLWAGVRLSVVRTDVFVLALGLGPGLAWQRVQASVIDLSNPTAPPRVYDCSGHGSVGFGLRAGASAAVRVGEGLSFTLDASFDNLRLSSDVLGGCVGGAGTLSQLGARLGVAYAFEVTRRVK